MNLEPAKNFGEISVALTFRTGSVGDSTPEQIVAYMFDQLVKALKENQRLKLWGVQVGKVKYEPFKETAGGQAFEYEPPKRNIHLGE